MIYGKDFVWLHLGKTGGTTVSHLFSKCPEIVEFRDLDADPVKHQGISDIKERLPDIDFETKDKIIGFRKIINWIVSHNHHMLRAFPERFTLKQIEEKSLMGFIHSGLSAHCGLSAHEGDSVKWASPDAWLMGSVSNLNIKHYIRTEYLYEDFINIMSEYGLKIKDNKRLLSAGNEKRNIGSYKKILYTQKQIKKIYNDNPIWMSIQNKIYDD
jgi:hypothetical protein